MKRCVTITKTNRDDKEEENGKDWFQILAIISACISAFTFGMLFSWPSPAIPKIVEDKVNYDISLDESSYFTVFSPIGAIVSSFLFAKLIDAIGRKYTLLLIAIPHITALILIAVAKSVYVFYASRFITGFGDACLFASLPIYVGEVATPRVRGSWGNVMTFLAYAGQMSTNIIGSYTTIREAAYITLIFPILFLCTFIFMPETPYFYLMKGRVDDARISLQRLRRKQNVEEELNMLKSDVDRQMSETGTWKDLVNINTNRRALYSGIFLRVSQQLSGSSPFMVYTQYIFQKSGSELSASTSAIIFMGLCALLNLCAAFTLDKVGRRKSYFLSLLLSCVVLFGETIYFFVEVVYPDVNVKIVNWIPLTGMILYMIFYSFGLGIVPTLMLGELFSASIKGKGLFLLNITFGVLVSVVTKLFHLLDKEFGLFAPFLFFSVSCFISTVLALYFVPETKGKTLEEIQQSLKGSKKEDLQKC